MVEIVRFLPSFLAEGFSKAGVDTGGGTKGYCVYYDEDTPPCPY